MKTRSLSILVSLTCLLFLALSHSVIGTTYFVATNGNDSAAGTNWFTAKQTIQAAIDLTIANDNVLVSNGVYAIGSRNTARVITTNAIILQSVNGPEETMIIGANSNDTNAVRCADIAAGSILSGFTLNYGSAVSGAGVACADKSSVVTNCVISDNSAWFVGGGVIGGTIYNCVISDNWSWYGGGASDCILVNCIITGNVAHSNGGGIDYSEMYNCRIVNNQAGDNGGGVFNSGLSNCVLVGNTADFGGASGGYGTLNSCIVSGNAAVYEGGGALFSTLNNSLLTGNMASEGGGASRGTLNNCTLSGNTALLFGGGACSSLLNNCVVYYNTAPSSPNYTNCTFNTSCTLPDPGGIGNITNNPQFVSFSTTNCHLSVESPCIDVGSNAFVQGATDIENGPRIVNGLVDMGAFEFREQAAIPTVVAGHVAFNWYVVTGCVYKFEYADNMATSLWRSISGVTTAQTSIISIPDTNYLNQGFIRCMYIVQ